MEPVAGNEMLFGKIGKTDITKLYPNESSARTEEVPVMGMEE